MATVAPVFNFATVGITVPVPIPTGSTAQKVALTLGGVSPNSTHAMSSLRTPVSPASGGGGGGGGGGSVGYGF